MFGLGFWEIAMILGAALIILGPSKLPELARSLGKGLREFRKATEDFKSTVDDELHKPEPPKIAPATEQPAQLLPPEADVAPAPVAEAAPVEASEPPQVEESDKKEAVGTES